VYRVKSFDESQLRSAMSKAECLEDWGIRRDRLGRTYPRRMGIGYHLEVASILRNQVSIECWRWRRDNGRHAIGELHGKFTITTPCSPSDTERRWMTLNLACTRMTSDWITVG
jgi:hypothetical protein